MSRCDFAAFEERSCFGWVHIVDGGTAVDSKVFGSRSLGGNICMG